MKPEELRKVGEYARGGAGEPARNVDARLQDADWPKRTDDTDEAIEKQIAKEKK